MNTVLVEAICIRRYTCVIDQDIKTVISMIDRLTSRGDSASALAQDPKPSKPLHKHDFHEAARAKEASNKEEEEEKRKYSAKKKRERYENWKEGLKKKRRAN